MKKCSKCLYHKDIDWFHKCTKLYFAKIQFLINFGSVFSQKLGQNMIIFPAISRSIFPAGIFPQIHFPFPREMRESCQSSNNLNFNLNLSYLLDNFINWEWKVKDVLNDLCTKKWYSRSKKNGHWFSMTLTKMHHVTRSIIQFWICRHIRFATSLFSTALEKKVMLFHVWKNEQPLGLSASSFHDLDLE